MTTKNKKGFTIIEVVLVLAIAGLIFMMVFIALPALQRSQRNTQREDDFARVLTAVNSFQTNNSGKVPFTFTTSTGPTGSTSTGSVDKNFVKRYVDEKCNTTDGVTYTNCGGQFTDPDGTIYILQAKEKLTANKDNLGLPTTVNNIIYAYVNASCGDSEGTLKVGSGDRQVALVYVEEGGAIYCNDNQ